MARPIHRHSHRRATIVTVVTIDEALVVVVAVIAVLYTYDTQHTTTVSFFGQTPATPYPFFP